MAVAEVHALTAVRSWFNLPGRNKVLALGCGPAAAQVLSWTIPRAWAYFHTPYLASPFTGPEGPYHVVVANLLNRRHLGEQRSLLNSDPLLPRLCGTAAPLPDLEGCEEILEQTLSMACEMVVRGGLLAIMCMPDDELHHVATDYLQACNDISPLWLVHPDDEGTGFWFPQTTEHPLLARYGLPQPRGRLVSFWTRT